jgi:hypothetical protein
VYRYASSGAEGGDKAAPDLTAHARINRDTRKNHPAVVERLVSVQRP